MAPEDFFKTLDKRVEQTNTRAVTQQQKDASVQQTNALINTIAQATKALIDFQAQHQPKVEVTNQKLPTSIKTPDIQKVVDALENLKQPIIENKTDDTAIIAALGRLNESIAKLPTVFPETPEPVETVTVKNQPDYTTQFDNLAQSIKEIDVKPVVNVPEAKPDDYTPILSSLSSVIEAVQAIKIPKVPTTDLSPLIQATDAVQQSIQNLKFPVANYILPFKDFSGKATQVQLDASGNLPVDITLNSIFYATRTDSATTANVTYVGKAVVGAATSAALWQVFKMDETTANTLIITWADGNSNFDNIWDNRASLSFS